MKKVAVTGGAGFIGSHLAEELAGRGYQVIIIDDLSTGRMSNIEHLLTRVNVEFVQGSVTDFPLLEQLFKGVDCVFHQAAIPGVPHSIANPLLSHEINVTGTLNVLLAASDNNVGKVIYASSSSVYGDTPALPKREDMLAKPQSPYAVTKLAAEYYCQVFHQVYSLPTICLRYFNVYGPRQDPELPYATVIPTFIKNTVLGNNPIVFGDGEQVRDFIFVEDVVAANILVSENDAAGIFNIGSGKGISINELAVLITRILRTNNEPIYQASRAGEIRNSVADISKAKTLGYSPKYSLEEGLRETIRRFQSET